MITLTDLPTFEAHEPDEDLTTLKRRIEETRWANKEPVADGSQGVQLLTVQCLAQYWTTDYSWRRFESCARRSGHCAEWRRRR